MWELFPSSRTKFWMVIALVVTLVSAASTATTSGSEDNDQTLKVLKSKKLSELQAILSKVLDSVNETEEVTTRDPRLTGDPRKDYVFDPNLPRELGDHDLSTYPFYNEIPKDITFKCDGKLDGYYASVPHQCQLFHLCVFGHRHDFLCANYTVFDQSQFICHFVNSVNCSNSVKHYERNSELYVTTTTTLEPPVEDYDDYPAEETEEVPRRQKPKRRRRPKNGGRRQNKRRRTTTTTTASPDEYYYDYEDTDKSAGQTKDEPTAPPVTTTSTEKIRRPVIRPPRPALRSTTIAADPQEAPIDPEVVAETTSTSRRRPAQISGDHSTEESGHDSISAVNPSDVTEGKVRGNLAASKTSVVTEPVTSSSRRRLTQVARTPPAKDDPPRDPMFAVNPLDVVGGILSGAPASSKATVAPEAATSSFRRRPAHVPQATSSEEPIHDPMSAVNPLDVVGGILSGAPASARDRSPSSARRRPEVRAPVTTETAQTHDPMSAVIGGILSGAGAVSQSSTRRPGRPSPNVEAPAEASESLPPPVRGRPEVGSRRNQQRVPPSPPSTTTSAPIAPSTASGRFRVVQRIRKPVVRTTTSTAPPEPQVEYEYTE